MPVIQVDEGAVDYGFAGVAGNFCEVFVCREVEADGQLDTMCSKVPMAQQAARSRSKTSYPQSLFCYNSKSMAYFNEEVKRDVTVYAISFI